MTDVLETLKKLPAYCFTVLPSNKRQVIGIKRGVSGYFEITKHATEEAAAGEARRCNAGLGITLAQVEAMIVGSQFGWDVPGADPDRYPDLKGTVQ